MTSFTFKNRLQLIIAFVAIILFSCGETGNSYEQITTLKTTIQRINALNKSQDQVRQFEEKAALSREENDYLEFEYPVREDESYVISYRFDDSGCFEIGLDTYFNTEKEAKNVADGIISEISNEKRFNKPVIQNEIYRWENKKESITVELDKQNIERGMISLTIFATK